MTKRDHTPLERMRVSLEVETLLGLQEVKEPPHSKIVSCIMCDGFEFGFFKKLQGSPARLPSLSPFREGLWA